MLLCHTKLQIKFEFGFDPLIFHEVRALELRKISRIVSFPHFSFVLSDVHLIFGTLLCPIKIQIKFKFSFDPLIFHEVMTLGIVSFPPFYRSCFQMFFWYLAHCFAILRYRLSSNLVSIHWFFTDYLVFGTLLCCTNIQIRFEFGFDPLIFHEVMVLEPRKISRIVSFPHDCSPRNTEPEMKRLYRGHYQNMQPFPVGVNLKEKYNVLRKINSTIGFYKTKIFYLNTYSHNSTT
jgi:hypothetical protein